MRTLADQDPIYQRTRFLAPLTRDQARQLQAYLLSAWRHNTTGTGVRQDLSALLLDVNRVAARP